MEVAARTANGVREQERLPVVLCGRVRRKRTAGEAVSTDDLPGVIYLRPAEYNRRISIFKTAPDGSAGMALEKEVDCPSCGETQSFYRTGAMTLHLGEKTKWRCPECGYGYVEIDGIDTLPA